MTVYAAGARAREACASPQRDRVRARNPSNIATNASRGARAHHTAVAQWAIGAFGDSVLRLAATFCDERPHCGHKSEMLVPPFVAAGSSGPTGGYSAALTLALGGNGRGGEPQLSWRAGRAGAGGPDPARPHLPCQGHPPTWRKGGAAARLRRRGAWQDVGSPIAADRATGTAPAAGGGGRWPPKSARITAAAVPAAAAMGRQRPRRRHVLAAVTAVLPSRARASRRGANARSENGACGLGRTDGRRKTNAKRKTLRVPACPARQRWAARGAGRSAGCGGVVCALVAGRRWPRHHSCSPADIPHLRPAATGVRRTRGSLRRASAAFHAFWCPHSNAFTSVARNY